MNSRIIFAVLVSTPLCSSCGFFRGRASGSEIVFAATGVGTPQGDKSSRAMGQGGGTYILAGPPEERTTIILNGIGTVVAPVAGSGGGTIRMGLTPIGPDKNCGD